jgi:hypothetical protein
MCLVGGGDVVSFVDEEVVWVRKGRRRRKSLWWGVYSLSTASLHASGGARTRLALTAAGVGEVSTSTASHRIAPHHTEPLNEAGERTAKDSYSP